MADNEGGEKCGVCLLEMLPDELISELPCRAHHRSHYDCIQDWIVPSQPKATCPADRFRLPADISDSLETAAFERLRQRRQEGTVTQCDVSQVLCDTQARRRAAAITAAQPSSAILRQLDPSSLKSVSEALFQHFENTARGDNTIYSPLVASGRSKSPIIVRIKLRQQTLARDIHRSRFYWAWVDTTEKLGDLGQVWWQVSQIGNYKEGANINRTQCFFQRHPVSCSWGALVSKTLKEGNFLVQEIASLE